MSPRRKVAIIGSGPAALMLAATLDPLLFDVSIYEKSFAPARKFLVAGDGGLNLTHSEVIEHLVKKYLPSGFLDEALSSFSNTDFCEWLESLGIKTYVGTSKRIYPVKDIKPIDVLNAILEHLKKRGVTIVTQKTWKGWTEDGRLAFNHKEDTELIDAEIIVFALGGASWPKTGSDGKWSQYFKLKDIRVNDFQPSNCEFEVNWKQDFINKNEGHWLKNITLTSEGLKKAGEIVITKSGLEGSPLYALSPQLRSQLNTSGKAILYLDLKPSFSENQIFIILSQSQKSITENLKDKLKMGTCQINLLKSILSKDEFINLELLANKIKALPIEIKGISNIEYAISTVGGIDLNEIDKHFQLKKMPNHYAIGEMLDWDAPTGGYLLQACFSMGRFVGKNLNEKKK